MFCYLCLVCAFLFNLPCCTPGFITINNYQDHLQSGCRWYSYYFKHQPSWTYNSSYLAVNRSGSPNQNNPSMASSSLGACLRHYNPGSAATAHVNKNPSSLWRHSDTKVSNKASNLLLLTRMVCVCLYPDGSARARGCFLAGRTFTALRC